MEKQRFKIDLGKCPNSGLQVMSTKQEIEGITSEMSNVQAVHRSRELVYLSKFVCQELNSHFSLINLDPERGKLPKAT